MAWLIILISPYLFPLSLWIQITIHPLSTDGAIAILAFKTMEGDLENFQVQQCILQSLYISNQITILSLEIYLDNNPDCSYRWNMLPHFISPHGGLEYSPVS